MTHPEEFPQTSGKVLIGGEWADGGQKTHVINPARTTEVVGEVALCSKDHVDAAISAAQNALPGWSQTRPEERAGRLQGAATDLRKSIPELTRLLVRENGKPLPEAERDIVRSIEMMDLIAADLPEWSRPELVEPNQPVWIRKRPRGVTAIISPWNSPVLLSFRRLVPAVAGGNSVVLKPATCCPLAVMECLRILEPHFPKGVLNLLTGSGEIVGDALVGDPRVSTVGFTGGTETGRRIIERSAATIKKLHLELGGNDPALVLADAVLDAAAIERMTRAILRASGQVCVAIKRIYVHESRHDELLDKLAEAFDKTTVGDGLAAGTTMGPLGNKAQFDFVNGLIDRSRKQGLDVQTYGRKLDGREWDHGYFLLPSIVKGVQHPDEIVGCEQFGPLVPIVPWTDIDTAVEWANDTTFGLRASVWTADRPLAEKLADRIHAGALFHNNHGIFQDLHVEFPGVRQSGLGRESLSLGLDHYTDAYGLAD